MKWCACVGVGGVVCVCVYAFLTNFTIFIGMLSCFLVVWYGVVVVGGCKKQSVFGYHIVWVECPFV